jgi:glutamyl-tRNA reductase
MVCHQMGQVSNTPKEWVDLIQQKELKRARNKIARGHSPEQVAESMATRIAQQFLHVVITELKAAAISTSPEDIAQGLAQYRAMFEQRRPPSDHVVDL